MTGAESEQNMAQKSAWHRVAEADPLEDNSVTLGAAAPGANGSAAMMRYARAWKRSAPMKDRASASA